MGLEWSHSDLWQIYAFGEENTRTTAVFFSKYLLTLGFDMTKDIFNENAWYFRDVFVRVNYNDSKDGIYETAEFLEWFLRNLPVDEHYLLYNRTLHIGVTFKETEKPDIRTVKPDIEEIKPDIGKMFHPKIVSHILKLGETDNVFLKQILYSRVGCLKMLGHYIG